MELLPIIIIFTIFFFTILIFLTLLAISYRKVVSTNEVHIVQSSKTTNSYGKDTGNGNTYYSWPSWIPVIGITKVILPVSVFDLDLKGYEAYDKGRLPFVVDVKAFFRIVQTNIAAQRVASFGELHNQLMAVVQGAVRSILANSDIEEIMQGRSQFGELFTKEVAGQLTNWGVEAVKNIELMDIRDGQNGQVIHQIMAKKKSHIEMESRSEVAKNKQAAEIAEIEASRMVAVQKQDAEQAVGLRTVENKKMVEIENQKAAQAIQEQQKISKERAMAVVQVEASRSAEINKEVEIINAKKNKETQVLIAEGSLQSQKLSAEAIQVHGTANANAVQSMQMAQIASQIALSKEIGENQNYQQYLITIEQVKANKEIGIEQAKAMIAANIKIIANAGDVSSGINKAMDIFSSKGGTQLGAMLEGFANTETGKAVLETVGVTSTETKH